MNTRIVTILLSLLLASCGGSQPTRPEWNGVEDIEIPWSAAKAPAAENMVPQETEASDDGALVGPSRSRRSAVIDVDVKDTDLHDAFRLIAESADINIVVADTVSGRITLRIRQAPWRQVLQTIANMKQLTLSQEGNIYYVR